MKREYQRNIVQNKINVDGMNWYGCYHLLSFFLFLYVWLSSLYW